MSRMNEQEMDRSAATEFVPIATGGSAGLAATPAEPLRIESARATPRHLVELPGGEWALWRWVALRGAGFPADGVLRLSAPAAAAAADLLLLAEARLHG